jgi:hypothetical protein
MLYSSRKLANRLLYKKRQKSNENKHYRNIILIGMTKACHVI